MSIRIALLLATLALCSCSTGRAPIPPGEIPAPKPVTEAAEQYGHTVLSQLTERYPLSNDDAAIGRVRALVDRLSVAARADQDPWHVYVLQGADVRNAAATRGNHMFVWTGLLNTAQNDGELVTVLAHEMGHLLADHPTPTSAEEATQAVPQVAGTVTRAVISHQGSIAIVAQLAEIVVAQALTAMLVNPESQRQELEADIIGMHLMAEAGFQPENALRFWERIQNVPYFSGNGLSFLSSHPSSEARIENLRANLPEAVLRYENFSHYTGIRPVSSPVLRSGEEVWIVEADRLALHSAPDSGSDIVGDLRRGERVTVVDRAQRWLKVKDPQRGWALGRYLSPER